MSWIRIASVAVTAGVVVFATACGNQTPAQTPKLVTFSVWTPDGPMVVPVSAKGAFSVLPLVKLQGIRATFKLVMDAPYPTALKIAVVDPAASAPVNLPQIPNGTPGPTSGFFVVNDIDVKPTPARWTVSVRLPLALMFKTMLAINIFDDSSNPPGESAPLNIPLDMTPPDYTVTVIVQGSGHVMSKQPGILCGTSPEGNTLSPCTFTFLNFPATSPPLPFPPFGVELDPNSNDDGTKFMGWTGACTGSDVCFVTLTGSPMTAIAHFGTAPQSGCLPDQGVEGFAWKEYPTCESAHPVLQCGTGGFFCCGSVSTNSGQGQCPAGSEEAQPLCGPGESLIQPGGCYRSVPH